MDYNFWDDRTHELEINPCKGCKDYQDGKCISNGSCGEPDRESKLLFLINYYGTLNQKLIAIEEMAELQKAIVKDIRQNSKENTDAVIEEVADVQVMLEQLKMIFSCRNKISEIMDAKIDRQIKRIMDESKRD